MATTTVIDLHCHILPGLDDGPGTMEESLAMALAARAAGITTVVATPHIRDDHPFDPAEIGARVDDLSGALAEEGIELGIVAGGELAISKIAELDEATLHKLCLGTGSYMLVESPYTDVTKLLEETLFDLQVRGFRPVLAHPERCPSFLADESRLAPLVERGVLCSVTAASMMGRFGGTVRKFCAQLFRERLVHNVASDAHDHVNRPLDLLGGFAALDAELPGALDQVDWFTAEVPDAIIAGRDLPTRPPPLKRHRRRLARLLRRESRER